MTIRFSVSRSRKGTWKWMALWEGGGIQQGGFSSKEKARQAGKHAERRYRLRGFETTWE